MHKEVSQLTRNRIHDFVETSSTTSRLLLSVINLE